MKSILYVLALALSVSVAASPRVTTTLQPCALSDQNYVLIDGMSRSTRLDIAETKLEDANDLPNGEYHWVCDYKLTKTGLEGAVDPIDPVPVDSDGDGIPDADDECPEDATNTCNDPPPVVDTDGDGVIDDDDQCLDTPAGDEVDNTGCTVVVAPPIPVGPGHPFTYTVDLRSASSIDSVRYKNPPTDPRITFDSTESAARVRLGPSISLGSAHQLYCVAPRNFGKAEGDSFVSFGWSVKYGTEWGAAKPAGLENHKLARLDNNKWANGVQLRPWEERMIEFNSRYINAKPGPVAIVGTRIYSYGEPGYTETYKLGVQGSLRYQPNNPGDVFRIYPDAWYDFRYEWQAGDGGRWQLSLFGKKEGEDEVLILTRPMDKDNSSARKLRCPELNSSQHRPIAWTQEEGYFDIWVRDFFITAR